ITGGLTLNGTATLGSSTVAGQLYFQGSQTLAGTGTVTFANYNNSNTNGIYAQGNGGSSPATLTIASTIAIQGGTGAITGYYTNDSVILNGQLSVSTGQTLSIGGANWVNHGTISAALGSAVNLGGSFTTASLGSFVAATGGTAPIVSVT